MGKLFSEFKVKDLSLKNRMVMAPMCIYQATNEGFLSNFHTVHYCSRAIGGVGLIILEATSVEARGRITEHDIGIWSDKHVEGLKELVNNIKSYGAKVGVQLAHAGRKCGVKGEKIISCSNISFSEKYEVPQEMSKENILEVIEAFKQAARRANAAGFDMIEIHAAHGYLINQFLSPLTNKRSDEYGKDLEGRMRFLQEILEAVKTVWPNNKPIFVRVSAEEFFEGGNTVDDIIKILNSLKDYIDVIDVSTGGVVNNAQINVYPGYQIKYAEKIKQETNLSTIAGGLVTSPEFAEEIVANNRSDLVYFGREFLRNPYFPLHAARTLNVDIEWPDPYKRGKK